MLPPSLRSAFPSAFLLAASLAGCSGTPGSGTPAETEESVRQFSEEDRLAARVLSVGNAGAMPEDGNLYDQAVLCSSAIETLADRLRQADTITAEQLRVVAQAKAVYDQRIRTLGNQARATDQPDTDPLQATGSTPPGGEALQAIGCIQRLAEAG